MLEERIEKGGDLGDIHGAAFLIRYACCEIGSGHLSLIGESLILKTWFTTLLLMALFLLLLRAVAAQGQGGDGEYLILSAQYGSDRHVNVTNQLKELARHDVKVWVDFRTFHVDPDEGHAKVRRIYARGPNGRECMFECRDGAMIDGSQFRGWSRGEWASENDHWSSRWEGEER